MRRYTETRSRQCLKNVLFHSIGYHCSCSSVICFYGTLGHYNWLQTSATGHYQASFNVQTVKISQSLYWLRKQIMEINYDWKLSLKNLMKIEGQFDIWWDWRINVAGRMQSYKRTMKERKRGRERERERESSPHSKLLVFLLHSLNLMRRQSTVRPGDERDGKEQINIII